MNKSLLGKTGIEVSKISFGTVALGLPYGIGVKDQTDMLAEADAIALLRLALDKGLNFYDTALGYGKSEQLIGNAFKGCRDKAVICSKPAHLYDSHSGQSMPPAPQIRPMLEESFKQSLAKLQTDYIDIYMSHDGTEKVIENEIIIDFYQQLKKKGDIRATGISVYTLPQAIKAIETGKWDVIQLAFNLMDQTAADIFPIAKQKGIGIMVRSVLMRGILTDKGVDLTHEKLNPVAEHRRKYLKLLDDKNSSLSDLATKFVLSFADVSSVLVGIDKMEFLNKAIALANGEYLDDMMLAQIKQFSYPDPEFLNIAMWDRKGWTK